MYTSGQFVSNSLHHNIKGWNPAAAKGIFPFTVNCTLHTFLQHLNRMRMHLTIQLKAEEERNSQTPPSLDIGMK